MVEIVMGDGCLWLCHYFCGVCTYDMISIQPHILSIHGQTSVNWKKPGLSFQQ